MHAQAFRSALLLVTLLLTGCGTDQFEREVDTEKAAVKLARLTQQGGYELLTTDEVAELLKKPDELVLIDAMPADNFAKEHLAGAKNFAFPKVAVDEWTTDETGGSQEEYEALLGSDKDKLIVVYCGFTNCDRSHNAAVFARQLGYTNVKRYAGGIYAWKGAGHPVTAGG